MNKKWFPGIWEQFIWADIREKSTQLENLSLFIVQSIILGKQIWTCNKLKVTGVHGQVSVNCAFSENFIFASDFYVQHFEEQKTSRYKYGKIWFLGAAIHLLEHLYTVCVKHELLSNLWHQPQLSRFIANSK